MTELVKAATINMLNMFKKMGWGKDEHDEERNGTCKKEQNQTISNMKNSLDGIDNIR